MKPSSSYPPPVVDNMELVTEHPINLCSMVAKAHHPKAGAIVLFSGEVRNHSHKRPVSHLFYECYKPMAEKMITKIVAEAKVKFNLHEALCVHRVGKVQIEETAVVVITASSHRNEAYEANRYIIDRVKHEAPIWKKEFFEDGTHEWGHNCSCHAH